MGRPKEFDRDEVLAKAIDLFWRLGFSNTSTQQLVEHLGINRKSMYSEFGNKRDLFVAALEGYEREVVDRNLGPLESRSAGLSELRELFHTIGRESQRSVSGLGCLMCNTAVEQATNDQAADSLVDSYICRLTDAFRNALSNAQRGGEIRSTVDTLAQARFLTSNVLGMSVLARVKAKPVLIDATTKAVMDHLASLMQEGV